LLSIRWSSFMYPPWETGGRGVYSAHNQHRSLYRYSRHSLGYNTRSQFHRCKGAITSKIKHAINLKQVQGPARLAQLLQPSLAFCFSLHPMTAHRPVAGLVLSFIACFFYLWSLLNGLQFRWTGGDFRLRMVVASVCAWQCQSSSVELRWVLIFFIRTVSVSVLIKNQNSSF